MVLSFGDLVDTRGTSRFPTIIQQSFGDLPPISSSTPSLPPLHLDTKIFPPLHHNAPSTTGQPAALLAENTNSPPTTISFSAGLLTTSAGVFLTVGDPSFPGKEHRFTIVGFGINALQLAKSGSLDSSVSQQLPRNGLCAIPQSSSCWASYYSAVYHSALKQCTTAPAWMAEPSIQCYNHEIIFSKANQCSCSCSLFSKQFCDYGTPPPRHPPQPPATEQAQRQTHSCLLGCRNGQDRNTIFQYSRTHFFGKKSCTRSYRESVASWGLCKPYSVGILDARHVFLHMTCPEDM